jgi:hypothetical protein
MRLCKPVRQLQRQVEGRGCFKRRTFLETTIKIYNAGKITAGKGSGNGQVRTAGERLAALRLPVPVRLAFQAQTSWLSRRLTTHYRSDGMDIDQTQYRDRDVGSVGWRSSAAGRRLSMGYRRRRALACSSLTALPLTHHLVSVSKARCCYCSSAPNSFLATSFGRSVCQDEAICGGFPTLAGFWLKQSGALSGRNAVDVSVLTALYKTRTCYAKLSVCVWWWTGCWRHDTFAGVLPTLKFR